MNIHIFSSHTFESWDWTNSTDPAKGIGGSETFATEMAWRLAQRGHLVTAYSPTGRGKTESWRGVTWEDSTDTKKVWFLRPGLWLFQRNPEYLDFFEPLEGEREAWVVCQDTVYPGWTEERAAKVRYVVCLCEDHAQFTMEKYPYLRGKVIISSNGIKVDEFRKLDAENIPRNPRKVVYTSSPDRGLEYALEIFRSAQSVIPDLEFHYFYGTNNIDKWGDTPHYPYLKKRIAKWSDHPQIHNHGRIGQPALWRHLLSSGIWLYPTTFCETNCISASEAMALGAIPITNPLWVLREKVTHGILIPGDAWKDPLVKARYVPELINLALDEERQARIRPSMMDSARHMYNWERIVDQFHAWICDLPQTARAQWSFQHTYATGKILNVGCNNDGGGLKAFRGAINVDIAAIDPHTSTPNAADMLMDARDLLFKDETFDSVVLGEILEHLSEEDAIKAVKETARVLRPGGQAVITVPEDHRKHDVVHYYANGISAHHEKPIFEADVRRWLEAAGLQFGLHQDIDLTFCKGHGVVGVKP